jgi:hypothetical protein
VRLRYFLESRLVKLDPPEYQPVGVWVQGPGPGLDVVMEYLPGNEDLQEGADWVINRLVEAGVKTLQPDFLDYHRDTLSPYRGVRSEIVETEEFGSAEECAADTLGRLASQNLSRQRRAI